jgi:hypothetical protein
VRNDLIPALDPAPIPGPPALLLVLWIVTFFLHLLAVNAAVGGSLFPLFLPPSMPGAARRAVARFFAEINSWALSLAITFAVAPLLFMQVLYGRFFYTASVLVAPAWLGLLLMLMLAYYLNWIAKFRLRAGKDASPALAISATLSLVIAAIQTSVHLASIQPLLWSALASHPSLVVGDATFVPRLMHFVLAAVSMAAVLPAAFPGTLAEEAPGAARFGLFTALVLTGAQFAAGLWLLLALPRVVLSGLMTGGLARVAPLGLAVLTGVALLGLLVRAVGAPDNVRLARVVLVHFGAAALFMVVTRHQVRDLYLAGARATERLAVAPQWSVLVLFLAVFVLCAGLSVWALFRAATDRPGPGEAAA